MTSRSRKWAWFLSCLLLLFAAGYLVRNSAIGGNLYGASAQTSELPGSGIKPAVDPSRLPLPPEVLTSWGYKETSSDSHPQADWERERFGKAAIRHQAIRSLAELPDMPRTYLRFTLVEERYATSQEADRRASDLTFIPAGMHSKIQPDLTLRKGFAMDSKVYFISTDSTRFAMEIPAVLDLLRKHCESTPPRDVFGEVPESSSERSK